MGRRSKKYHKGEKIKAVKTSGKNVRVRQQDVVGERLILLQHEYEEALITGINSSAQSCSILIAGDGYVDRVFPSHLGGYILVTRRLIDTKPCSDWKTIPVSTSTKSTF